MHKKKSNKKENLDSAAIESTGVSEWVKKTLLTGVGALFMTEEGIRNALLELNLPKSVISSALSQADKTKKELISSVAKEVRQFLKDTLAGHEIEIKASIRLKKDESKKKAAK